MQVGVRTAKLTSESNGKVLGKPAREGESPVHERRVSMAVSRVCLLYTSWTITDVEDRKRGEQTGLDTLVVHAVNDDY